MASLANQLSIRVSHSQRRDDQPADLFENGDEANRVWDSYANGFYN